MLPLEGSKEEKTGSEKIGLRKFKVKITKGHYEASIVDDLRRPGLSRAFFSSFFLFLPSIILRQKRVGTPFFSPPTLHIHYLWRDAK